MSWAGITLNTMTKVCNAKKEHNDGLQSFKILAFYVKLVALPAFTYCTYFSVIGTSISSISPLFLGRNNGDPNHHPTSARIRRNDDPAGRREHLSVVFQLRSKPDRIQVHSARRQAVLHQVLRTVVRQPV